MKKRICLLSHVYVIILLISTNSYCFNEVQPILPMNLVSVEGYISDCNNGAGISNVLVETQNSNVDKSNRAYSNIFSRELYNIVNFTITTCDGNTGDSAESMPSNIESLEVIWGDKLPFFEDWESGSFETQYWEVEGENWQIVDIGDDMGFVAKFSWSPVLDSVYYESITTTFINADSVLVGNFYVDYDYKLDDVNSTASEYIIMQIKQSLGDEWISVDTLKNEGTVGWTNRHISISEDAINSVFQIRFVAAGTNSSNIYAWYLDNINVYSNCGAPEDITATYFWNAGDEYGISLCWEALEFPGPNTIYKHWDSGVNYSSVGFDCTCENIAASRWSEDMLEDLEGYSITSILFYLYDEGYDNVKIKVWQGDNAEELIYEQDVPNAVSGQFTEVIIDNPVLIDVSKEVWIGYEFTAIATYFPAGVDEGPAVAGYGDKISLDGYSWDNLSDFGLDYNWNLGMKLEIVDGAMAKDPIYLNSKGIINDSKPQPILGKPTKIPVKLNLDENVSGFNIYMKEGNQDEYQLFDFVPYNLDQTSYCKNYFAEDEVQSGKCYSFQITSVKVMDVDSCESDPGLSVDGEDYTYACVTDIDKTPLNFMNVYPIPANDQIIIKAQEKINELTIINYLGQIVYEINGVETKKYVVNSSKFPTGIYIVNIKTSSHEYSRKAVIAR